MVPDEITDQSPSRNNWYLMEELPEFRTRTFIGDDTPGNFRVRDCGWTQHCVRYNKTGIRTMQSRMDRRP